MRQTSPALECSASQRRVLWQYCFIQVEIKNSNLRYFWELSWFKHLPIFSSPCDNCHKKSFAITVSFSLLFVTFEHNVNRLEQKMSPNMSYFKLKLSNLELNEFLFQNCLLYFTSCQLRLQKLLPPPTILISA